MKKTSNVSRYRHRKLAPEEFDALFKKSGISRRDYLFLTGMHSMDLDKFRGILPPHPDRHPKMADILVLELIAEDPEFQDTMMDIVNSRYDLGAQEER
jgi:hypothetical protein